MSFLRFLWPWGAPALHVALEPRKLVRDALYTLFSASGASGFNAQYAAAIAASYPNAETVSIDWSPGLPGNTSKDPKQFFWGQVETGQIDADQVLKYPGVRIYTTLTDGTPSAESVIEAKFSGLVRAHIDWDIKHRGGAEKDDTESTPDAIEDAVQECLYNFPSQSNIAWDGDYLCDRPAAELLGNGFRQRIPMILNFFVSV
jgi:hypothetical protein